MEHDCPPSTSISTIRGVHRLDTLTPATSGQYASELLQSPYTGSAPPSSPGSPSDSVSSFPSVSSSFLFSSVPASPPHSHGEHARRVTESLIIPSLTLPAALRNPTPYGRTVGDVRLLILGPKGAGKTTLAGLLVDGNEDVVEVGLWEDTETGSVLHASTDWIEHSDAHGLEKYEPTHNVEIVELLGYDNEEDPDKILRQIIRTIQAPFHPILEALNPEYSGPVLANLLASSNSPLFTVLIFLTSAPSPSDHIFLNTLGEHIPIIVLPQAKGHQSYSTSRLSSFRPPNAHSLREGIFRSPATLARLRAEAADRFLRWRELERAVERLVPSQGTFMGMSASERSHIPSLGDTCLTQRWDKARWEAEWETKLSENVATSMRQRRAAATPADGLTRSNAGTGSWASAPFDPLHLPSVFMMSLSLLGSIRTRVGQSIHATWERLSGYRLGLAFIGVFCAGIGMGFWISRV